MIVIYYGREVQVIPHTACMHSIIFKLKAKTKIVDARCGAGPAPAPGHPGHAQMASTAIIAAPRQMATTFIVARGHDTGFFKPHHVSEKVNSCGSV